MMLGRICASVQCLDPTLKCWAIPRCPSGTGTLSDPQLEILVVFDW